LMTGNLMLASLGASVGLLLAWVATNAMTRMELPLSDPIVLNFAPDFRVLLVTAGIAILTSLLFGLAPATRATRVDVNTSLKDGDAASTGHSSKWIRNALVAVQVGGSVVVLVAAALFLHSLWNGFSTNLGFRPQNLLIVRIDTTAQGYSTERSALFFQQLEDQVSGLPGVRSASVVAPLPLGIFSSGRDLSVPGTSRTINANLHMVGRRYFETMGIPVLNGRDFREPTSSSSMAAVINRTMAEHLFPNENPIGRQIRWQFGDEKKTYDVLGVVGDAKSKTIGEPFRPCLFELASQNQKDLRMFSSFGGVSVVIRTVGDPKALAPAVAQAVERFDPGLPVYGVESMQEQVAKSLVLARLVSWFLGVFAILAVVIAAVGLYGLISYSVTARTREIAIRMAMGASRESTLSLLARQGLSVTAVGLVAGLAVGLAVGRVVSSLLYGVGGFDVLTFTTVPVVLLLVSCIAILLPARRATKVDPVAALRHE